MILMVLEYLQYNCINYNYIYLLILCLDKNILINNLEGHKDAVWGISVHHNRSELLSCSADGSVKLWSPTNLKTSCLSSYVSNQGI